MLSGICWMRILKGIHGVVVELAAVGDLVFQIRDSSLQTHEIVVGLQLRIILGDGFSLDRSLDRVVRRTSHQVVEAVLARCELTLRPR